MRFLIMANGDYGELEWYRERRRSCDRLICADGGAAWAGRLSMLPDWVIGDMDSISKADRELLERSGTVFHIYPQEKDYTDTQLAMTLAAQNEASEITVWGGMGNRLDHTLANLFSAGLHVQHGIDVRFEAPAVTVYLVRDRLVLCGRAGETVSVLALGDRAAGVVLQGFRYPLNGVVLEGNLPCGISNVITSSESLIQVASGVLAVFYYRVLPERLSTALSRGGK